MSNEGPQFRNNAVTTLDGAISSSATSMTVALGTGSLFPAASTPTYFYATIYTSPSVFEIVKVTFKFGNSTVWTVERAQEGTSAQAWPSGANVELRITAAGIEEARHRFVDIQHFTTVGNSTWTKPDGAKLVFVQMWGAGGGGGSGRRRAIASQSTAAAGGSGGAGGGYKELWLPALSLGSSVTVSIQAGGAGGASRTSDNSNGAFGGTGAGSTSFNFDHSVGSGGGGGGGETATVSQSLPASEVMVFNSSVWSVREGRGGAGNPSAGGTAQGHSHGGGGGGGGGGYAANGTAAASGGQGGAGALMYQVSSGGINAPGAGGTSGGNGGAGSRTSIPDAFGLLSMATAGGGGGGGGSAPAFTSGQASAPGGNGGDGGWPGGGGGGGAAAQGANSGAGGNGGSGYIRVTTFF